MRWMQRAHVSTATHKLGARQTPPLRRPLTAARLPRLRVLLIRRRVRRALQLLHARGGALQAALEVADLRTAANTSVCVRRYKEAGVRVHVRMLDCTRAVEGKGVRVCACLYSDACGHVPTWVRACESTTRAA